ncbi:MAG: phospholipase D-like domain-containing protein [Bdellovibrionota bacterium]
MNTVSLAISKYMEEPRYSVANSSTKLLQDGPEVFHKMIELIDEAQSSIDLEIYAFMDDRSGFAIQKALLKALHRGCNVRIIYDSFGSFNTKSSFFEKLKQSGAKIMEFHPLWSPGKKMFGFHLRSRNHRKVLIVDDLRCIIGGLNIGDEYFKPVSAGGIHDLAIYLKGQIALQALTIFESTWKNTIRIPILINKAKSTPLLTENSNQLQILGSKPIRYRWKIRKTIHHAIKNATKSIDIINPYFVPPSGLARALKNAAARGVKVRILVPKKSDLPLVHLASYVARNRLLHHGVEFYSWPGFVHAKAMLIDDQWFSVGSYNLDYQSLKWNLEVIVNGYCPNILSSLKKVMDEDFGKAEKYTSSTWKKFHFSKRFFADFLYSIRTFL